MKRVFFLVFILSAALVSAAPKSDLWSIWTPSDEASTATIDHSTWNEFLSEYVSYDQGLAMNVMDYAGAKGRGESQLRRYISEMEKIKILSYSRAEQKAYWINLYNAVTVKLILDFYPLNSIRDISFGIFGPGPWDEELVTVEGTGLTLNDIEHRILRPIWNDPRIHFAVNCASIGCPDLWDVAYTAENTESIMDQAALRYANHPRGVRFEGDRLVLSSIFNWYSVDFKPSPQVYLAGLRSNERGLANWNGWISHEYDWALNRKP
jgi:hypothetical protein